MRHTQGDEPFYLVAQGRFIRTLACRIGSVRGIILSDIKLFSGCGGKAGIGGFVPLHGRTGTGSAVAAFHGSKPFHITQTDFIAVIDKRRTGHGKQESKRYLHFFGRKTSCQTVHIVVAGRNTDKPSAVCLLIIFFVFCHKFFGAAFSAGGKIRLFAAEQIVVVGRTEMQQEVHMETADKTLVRFAPFAYHGGSRKFFVKESADVLPEGNGALAILVVFN